MVYDMLQNISRWKGLHPNLDTAIRFLQGADLSALKNGHFELDGDAVFFNVVDAATEPQEALRFETHQRYADIQMDLEGSECMLAAPLSALAAAEPYDPIRDIAFYTGAPTAGCALERGAFVLLLPGEPHMPCVARHAPAAVRKLVVKVRMD